MTATAKPFPFWCLLIVIGSIFLAMGIFSFIDPFSSYYKLVKYMGLGLFGNGIILLIAAILNKKYPAEQKWMQAECILNFFFAVIFIFNPLVAFIGLPYMLGAWMLLAGILKTLAALSLRSTIRGWGFIVTVGLLFIFFGLLLWYSPLVRASDISYLIGSFGVIMGLLFIIDAFRLRHREGAVNMII
jgi:uncharacterized membrane protein HdeD (DUF308 family)